MPVAVKGAGKCTSRKTLKGETMLPATNGDQSALEVADDHSVTGKRKRTNSTPNPNSTTCVESIKYGVDHLL